MKDEAVQRLTQATETHRERQRQEAESLRDLHAAIVAAAASPGTRQRDIVAITGLTRERIRQICKAAEAETQPPAAS
ncbi:hypothetical protein [Embleya sp. NPDC005971]|uniref:hypothetical protein n=1 Tax=Embleya sp. NPDC005971 TaxID=3156724 RepID=UPI0033EB5AD6